MNKATHPYPFESLTTMYSELGRFPVCHKLPLAEYPKAFRLEGCQVDAFFALNEVAGLEYFGYEPTFSKLFPKLMQSYALGAVD